jgi:hypothetical protein
LNALREAGLIEVLPQERKSRNGRYAVARIRLTRQACQLVGLLEFETDPEVVHIPPPDKMSPGHTLSEPTFSKHQRPRLIAGLPEDLAWLTGKGLSRAGIFKLMGKAKTNGKRLSDIVTVVAGFLEPLTGGRLFAYLAKLADGPTDFSVAAVDERRRRQAAHEAARLRSRAKVFRERFAGTTLTNRSQTRLFQIDPRARFVQVWQQGFSSTTPLNDVEPWIERMRSGELLLATEAVEQAFALPAYV